MVSSAIFGNDTDPGSVNLEEDTGILEVTAPVDPGLRKELLTHVEDRGQVTVRCSYSCQEGQLVRIWRSTYLVCRHSGHRSELLHAEGITLAPQWCPVMPGEIFRFTLVFAPLPKGCAVFDLVEVIPQPGAFHVPGILRNRRDMYDVRL